MAPEGLLEGVGGGEAPEPEAPLPARPDALASALAVNQAQQPKQQRSNAAAFLKAQTRLVELQTKHFDEERRVAITSARTRLFIERLKAAFQLFFAGIAALIGVGIALMLHDALTSRSVVVDPFDAPPALAARGLSGKVVAGGLLDELTRLQQATHSAAQKRNLSNAWTSDIKVEVPETGVSIGEIDRLLKDKLGHDLHIEGDLVQTDTGGLDLTVRGDGVPPKSFAGGPADLPKLTTQAAEYIYSQAEPALYVTYLYNSGRYAEAINFSKGAYLASPDSERPYLLNNWANALINSGGPQSEALSLYRSALKLKPDYWIAYNNVINATWGMGDEEGAWRAGQQLLKAAGGRPGKAGELYYQNLDTLTWNLIPWQNAQQADAQSNAGFGSAVASVAPSIADVDIRMHDPQAANLAMQTAPGGDLDPSVPAFLHYVRGRIAEEAGQASLAADELEAFAALYDNPVVATQYPGYRCWLAPAEEAAGRLQKADEAIAKGGRYVDCYRFKADMLDHRGDWAGAQAAYSAAAALAPDLPAAYYSWGLALMRHGQADAAMAKLELAHARGPHWADPLKAMGDIEAGRGRWKSALANYQEALRWAPAWAELHRARAEAARHAG